MSVTTDQLSERLHAQLRELTAHEPGARAGDDPEAVHQMRVAVRRLRSVLKIVAGAADPAVRQVRTELKWLGGVLGDVRDLDVLIGDLRPAVSLLPEPDRRAGLRLVEVFLAERQDARQHLITALDGARYRALRQQITALADRADLEGQDPAAEPAEPAEPGHVLRKPYRALTRALDTLPADPDDERLHALRIHCKRLRYAAELLRPTVRKKRVATARRACRQLQEILGEHQDAVVAAERIRSVAAAQDDPGLALAAGRIIEQKAGQRTAMREAWPTAARRVREAFADLIT